MSTINFLDTPSVSFINRNSVNAVFSQIDNAMDNYGYKHAAEIASTAMEAFNELKNSLSFPTLDYRSCAFNQSGKRNIAINVAQKIIKLMPTSSKGYDRLGNLYSIQGKQQNAIDTYERALENVLPNDPTRIQLQHQQNIARKKNKKRIDFMSKLPTEVADDILSELPQESKAICLHVSSKWRKCLLNCPNARSTLEVQDESEDVKISSVLSQIASYVKNLTLNTSAQTIWSRYCVV